MREAYSCVLVICLSTYFCDGICIQEFISSFSPCAEDCHPVLPIKFTSFRSFKMSTGLGLESLVDRKHTLLTHLFLVMF